MASFKPNPKATFVNNPLIRLLICFLTLHCSLAMGEALENSPQKPQITWLVEDKVENINLLSKTSPDTSAASYIENLIISQLDQYNIKIQRGTTSRNNRHLKEHDNACLANRANTKERREFSIFSEPQAFYITHKLYRFDAEKPLPKTLFNDKGEIKSLPDLFSALPNAKIGLAQDVSYGNFLDRQLKHINKNNIYYRGGSKRVIALEAMLYSKRVDMLLALPIDIVPTNVQYQLLEKYAIEGAPPYLIAYFNCSDSKLGKQIIADINKILRKTYQTDDYYLAHKKWFSEQELADLQLFLQRKFTEQIYITPKK